MATTYRWPLSVSTFTLADKAKLAWWLLTSDRFTMGEKVAAFEARMTEYSGMHALMVANGSVANQLVFELWKVKNPGVTPVVICPAVTWISSITPAMMAGMEVVFCDVNLTDFAFDYLMLEELMVKYADRRVILWPTALIGFVPDMDRLRRMARKHGAAEVYLDSCENTFSRDSQLLRPAPHGPLLGWSDSILASADITTTSTYFSHMVVSVEGGFVFFRDQADYDLARMFRNHGMARSLPAGNALRQQIEAANPKVDPQFLFGVAGTNLRPSDVHAAFGLLDMERAAESRDHRVLVYAQYSLLLDQGKYYLPPAQRSHVPFCLPVFIREPGRLAEVKAVLTKAGIECRPVVGSHLAYQPALKHLFTLPEMCYPNAYWIHHHGCYVGVHSKVTPEMVRRLTSLLNSL
jgi:CDP-4-dehydro-6-deoxyglucose reductase, E1